MACGVNLVCQPCLALCANIYYEHSSSSSNISGLDTRSSSSEEIPEYDIAMGKSRVLQTSEVWGGGMEAGIYEGQY